MIQEKLNALLDQINRKIQLEEQLPKLRKEISAHSLHVDALYQSMLAEQSDVDKLESGGISAVFHKLTGRMEEKLDKERTEAQTASDKYHEASAALNQMQLELDAAEQTLDSLKQCKIQYSQLMLDQINRLEAQLQDPENEMSQEELKILIQLERRRKSLREALLESEEADRAAQYHLTLLQTAQNAPENASWSQEQLQKLEVHTETLLAEITDLQAKLAQMGIDPGPHLSIDSYLRAPVVFLIGTGEDSSPLQQIANAIHQIEQLQTQIAQIEEKLSEALSQIESAISKF